MGDCDKELFAKFILILISLSEMALCIEMLIQGTYCIINPDPYYKVGMFNQKAKGIILIIGGILGLLDATLWLYGTIVRKGVLILINIMSSFPIALAIGFICVAENTVSAIFLLPIHFSRIPLLNLINEPIQLEYQPLGYEEI